MCANRSAAPNSVIHTMPQRYAPAGKCAPSHGAGRPGDRVIRRRRLSPRSEHAWRHYTMRLVNPPPAARCCDSDIRRPGKLLPSGGRGRCRRGQTLLLMGVPAHIFREYDIRGVVGRDLDAETAEAIARGFSAYLERAGVRQAVVGHDNRASSQELYAAATRGLTNAGCDVVGIGLAITPMLYFSLHHFELQGGMMVTASHNPPEFNGFKLCAGPGTLYGTQIQEVRALADAAAGSANAAPTGATETRVVYPAYRQT